MRTIVIENLDEVSQTNKSPSVESKGAVNACFILYTIGGRRNRGNWDRGCPDSDHVSIKKIHKVVCVVENETSGQ